MMSTYRYPTFSAQFIGKKTMTKIVASLTCLFALTPLMVLSQSQPLPGTAVPRTAAPAPVPTAPLPATAPAVGGYQPYVLNNTTAGAMAPNLRRMLNDLIGGADVQVDAANKRIFV